MLLVAMMPFAMQAQHYASTHIDTTVKACGSYTWNVTNQTYDSTGAYVAFTGDTLWILDLTVYPVYNDTLPMSVNGGCTYTWGNQTYNTPGYHSQTFRSSKNCDSTVTVDVVINSAASVTYYDTVCEMRIWKGDTLTTSGTYNKNIPTSVSNTGCDSVLTLNLVVIQPEQKWGDTIVSSCYKIIGYMWDANSMEFPEILTSYDTTSELYTLGNKTMYHPRTVARCFDTNFTVHFVVKPRGLYEINPVSCDSYTLVVGSSTYEYTFSRPDTITLKKAAANGCDSLIVVNVTINPTPVVTITGDTRVAKGESATLIGSSNQTVNYLWSTGETTETIVTEPLYSNKDYFLVGTNPSTGCQMTTYVTVLANDGINGAEEDNITIYPNPTTAMLNIAAAESVKSIAIFNIAGQQMMSVHDTQTIDLRSLSNGTYVVRIELANGAISTRTIVLSK